MPSPSLTWDLATVFGTWRNLDGSLKAGTYTVTIPVRVTDHTDDTIVPAGTFKTGTLNSITEGTPSLSVSVPCTDDPDIDQTGWQVQISVSFTDNSATENYSIDVPYANRPVGSGGNGLGVDLRPVALASSTATQTVGQYKVGTAGGLALLNSSGQVIDASGTPVTGGGGGTVTAANITDATTVGRNVLKAADQATARTALGAGTSSLALGTSSTTALAGNTALVPPTRTVNGHPLSADVTVTNSDVGALGFCVEVSGTYPARPASTAPVAYMGPTSPTGGGTTAGGSGAVNGLDLWFQTVS